MIRSSSAEDMGGGEAMGSFFRMRRAVIAILFWLGLFVGLVLMDFHYEGAPPSGTFPTYLMILWSVMIGWNLFESSRLLNYMHRNHFDRWKTLTFGVPGSYRSGKVLQFVFGRQEISDPQLRVLRANAGTATIVVVMTFVHLPFSRILSHAIAEAFR
jgi:hypothetical protein